LFQWLAHRLSAQRTGLINAQKTLTADPIVTLAIGSHTLDTFVWGYRYDEKSEDRGGLTLWLDNRDDRFDDLATDYPDIVRGAAIDLRRGMSVLGVATTEKLPRTWIEGFRYRYIEGAAVLELQCIDWREKLYKFHYATEQTWTATEASTICASILGEVSLTLATGSFGFTTNLTVSARRSGDQALVDLMRRVNEFLYPGPDGEIRHKILDPSEASSYVYDFTAGAGNHPLMRGSEVAETTPKFNKVTVVGGSSKEYTGSAQDDDEIALVGTRLRTLTDRVLSSNAQCTEQARSELRYWQAQTITGRIVARPHFTLRLYDIVAINAPPWGGPTVEGRVRRFVEEYGRGTSLWQQTIDIGGLAGKTVASGSQDVEDGVVTAGQMDENTITADEILAGTITAGEIAAGAIDTEQLAAGAVEASKINVSTLSAITADMGTLTAGTVKMGTGTKDVDLSGFQIDPDELVGQNSGTDQVVLSSSDGKITAGAGALILDQDGIQANSGNEDVNKLKIRDGSDTVLAMYGEVSDGTGTSGTLECAGKQAADPEGLLELIAITYDGTPASGVASVTMTLDTETSLIDVGGAVRMRMGTCYLEMTEQGAAPDAPGANRGRLYLIDNGAGKTQLCIRFNTGAVQVIATEP
jgi:hypothetical protein